MTKGLLISRNNKNQLHKLSLSNPTDHNITKYKSFRNMYNTVFCNSKKTLLWKQAKNPR